MKKLHLTVLLLLTIMSVSVLADVSRDPQEQTNKTSIVLRSGDNLRLLLPGEQAFIDPFQIDRQGRLLLPEVGLLDISGLTLSEATQYIKTQLAVSFRDLDKFDVILKERRIPVTVLGYVKQPGEVELPNNGNVQMAINLAGDLAQGAQLNKLQLRRGHQTTSFDYKLHRQ